MDVPLLLLADYANATAEGKLNVMGIFATINAPAFPARHLEMYLVLQLSASPPEYGHEFDLSFRFMDSQSNPLFQFDFTLKVPASSNEHQIVMNHIVRLQNLVFSGTGFYNLYVLIDGEQKAELSIQAIQISSSTA